MLLRLRTFWRVEESPARLQAQFLVTQARGIQRKDRFRTDWPVNFRSVRGCKVVPNYIRLKRRWFFPDFRRRQFRNSPANWTEWDLWPRKEEQRRRGRTLVLLEHTAGQGTSLGATFEQLASIIARVDAHPRVGVCLDTCHLLAAGYDIASAEGYAETFAQFGRLVGFDRLKVLHLNDSRRALGSHVDRHEHIGQGFVGIDAFRRLVNDRRFRGLPMLLETPKTAGRPPGVAVLDPLDEQNLNRLRGLIVR